MIRRILLTLSVVTVLLASYALPVLAATFERFEHYITGDGSAQNIEDEIWKAQTFTPSTAHKILSVKLKLIRDGLPGEITVGIRKTNESGHPTDGDLCLGTMNGNLITTEGTGLWYTITLGSGYNLDANTQYAIVVRAPFATEYEDYINWRTDYTEPAYLGGGYEKSNDYGSTWEFIAMDFMFEEWGEETSASISGGILKVMMPMVIAIGIIITGLGIFRGNFMVAVVGIATGVIGFVMIQVMLAML